MSFPTRNTPNLTSSPSFTSPNPELTTPVSIPGFDPSLPLPDTRHEQFCQAYLVKPVQSWCAYQAGYAIASASNMGSKLMKTPTIIARLQFLLAERKERLKLTHETVLQEIAMVAFSSRNDYVSKGSGEIDVKEGIDPIQIRAVSSVEYDTREYWDKSKDGIVIEEKTKVRLFDKMKALELAGKHLGLFHDRLKIEDPDGILAKVLGISREELPE